MDRCELEGGKGRTFLALAAAIRRTGGTGGVIGSVTGGGGGGVVVVDKRIAVWRRGGTGGGGGRRGARGGGGGGGRKAPHARALLHGRHPLRQPHPEEPHAPSPRRTRPGVVAVVAAVRAPPRHLRLRRRLSPCSRPPRVDLSLSAERAASATEAAGHFGIKAPTSVTPHALPP